MNSLPPLHSDLNEAIPLAGGNFPDLAADPTLRRQPDLHSDAHSAGTPAECCLVQIYPADVIDGMMLLEQREFSIGRSEDADLSLFDSSVSRQHAVLIRGEDGYQIRDLNSTNGTLVNEQAIQGDRHLNSGDTLHIGSFMFRFLSADSVESQYHETVYSALTRDALTGTLNKRYLLEALNREISRSTRAGLHLTVIMLDIDHFKSVNDTYGHLVGDDVLRTFGKRVSDICRSDDLLARYGGEEFCMVLAATAGEEAREIAERCRRVVVDEPFATTAGPLNITASFGLSCLEPGQQLTTAELLEAADQQLYQAKRSGRNQVSG